MADLRMKSRPFKLRGLATEHDLISRKKHWTSEVMNYRAGNTNETVKECLLRIH